MDRKKTRIGTIMLMLGVAISDNAQSGVTYNHDSSKKNQITVMEIGSGSLSPELYYQLLHTMVTTQVGLSYSPMHNFPRCNQRE